jgi:hypothetical protein
MPRSHHASLLVDLLLFLFGGFNGHVVKRRRAYTRPPSRCCSVPPGASPKSQVSALTHNYHVLPQALRKAASPLFSKILSFAHFLRSYVAVTVILCQWIIQYIGHIPTKMLVFRYI